MRAHHTLAQVGSKIGTDFTIMIHDLNKIFTAQSDLFANSMAFLRVNFLLIIPTPHQFTPQVTPFLGTVPQNLCQFREAT